MSNFILAGLFTEELNTGLLSVVEERGDVAFVILTDIETNYHYK
jgi:hypothetical protein